MKAKPQIRDEAITGLEDATRAIRVAEASRLEHLARGYAAVTGGEMATRAYITEAALALGVSEPRVASMLGLAVFLIDTYRDTHALVLTGEISLRHAEIITDAGMVITNVTATGVDQAAIALALEQDKLAEQRRHAYEQEVLVYARELTPNRLRPVAKRLAERWAVEPIEVRQAREAKKRRVTVVQLGEGMAELRAYLPAVQALGLYDRLTRMGRAVKRGLIPAPASPDAVTPGAEQSEPAALEAGQPGEAGKAADTRGLDELRADAFYALLSRDPFDAAEAAAHNTGADLQGRVQLVLTAAGVDALLATHGGTIIRDSSMPAGGVKCELKGYGPIDIESVRPLIAGRQQWDLVTVCTHTGTVIRTDTYRPNKSQERFLVARDGHCRFPGCVSPVYRSEIDHTIDAALGGPTATDNLAHLCRSHHTLKGNSDWTVRQFAGGVLEWTAPSGRIHIDRPRDLLPEHRASRHTPQRKVRFKAVVKEPDLHPF
ncbi:HNH endonuclease signature motif containing protein [Leucobacter sp. BZR 635]